MGLLDMFGSMSPEQTQGLLAMAAQIAQSSNNIKGAPNTAAAMAQGGLAYQQQMDKQRQMRMEEDRFKQTSRMQDFAIKDKESDYKKQEEDRARQDALRKLAVDFYGGGQSPAMPMPPGQSAAASMQGMIGAAPQPEAPAAPAMAAPAASLGSRASAYQRKLEFADYLRSKGQPEAAAVEEAAALKLQPKVSNWKEVRMGDKVLYAPYFEDGTSGQPVPYEVAEKLHFANLGGKTVGVDQYTGATKASYSNTMTPDGAAADARARQTNQLKREEINAGGRPPAGYRWTAKGELEAIPGGPASLAAKMAKAPTEFQGKSAVFGAQAEDADRILNELDGKYSPAAINAKKRVENTWVVGDALGAGMNKYALSGADQTAEQAQRQFVRAKLRLESGAAIGKDEFEEDARQLFPQPGDGPDVIAQKARNRKLVIQGLKQNAGQSAYSAPAAPSKPKKDGWSIQKVN